MKMLSIKSKYIPHTLKAPAVYITILIVTAYSSLALINPNILLLTTFENNPPFVLANYTGYFSITAMTFFTIPLYFIFMQPVIHYFQNVNVVIRYTRTFELNISNSIISFIQCLYFIFYIYIMIFVRCVWFAQIGSSFEYLYSFMQIGVIILLILYATGTLLYIFTLLFRYSSLAFLATYGFYIYDYTARNFGFTPIPILGELYMIPGEVIENYLLVIFYLILMNLSLIVIKQFILKNQDHIKIII